MSASAPPFKEQSSFNCLGASQDPPPSYSSLYPDYPDAGHAVGSINSNQFGYPPYTPYPRQQYVITHEGTPLIGTTPLTIYPKQPTVQQRRATTLLYVGSCPLCRVGVLEDEYPFVAICCAVLFFPLGLLCCLPLRQKRCNNCDYVIE